ncbi:MAG: TM1266 family iron-only hydrogenase system putative regulator [Anaerovoracaceae bacterium]|jgi:putative iron-only hydrogenase system regulator
MSDNTRVAVIGVIVEDNSAAAELNDLLHEYADTIFGRMGIPHREKGIFIISIAVDADEDTINALSGKLGAIEGVSTKTIYSKA